MFISMFIASVGPLLAAHRPVGVNADHSGEELGPPGLQRPRKPEELRDA
jgi:hypothetical protein